MPVGKDDSVASGVNRLSHGQLISITFTLFPLWFHTTTISVVLMPNQVLHYQGAGDRGVGYGITMTVAGVAGVFIGPLIGWLSDRTLTRWGRRRPWIFVGMILNCGIGVLLAFAPSLLAFSVLLFFDVITFMMVYMNISALVPDVVPESQSGMASGYMQLFMMGGGFAASILGLFAMQFGSVFPGAFQFNTYAVEIGIMLLSVPVLWFVRETGLESTDGKDDAYDDDAKASRPGLVAQLRPFWNVQYALLVLLTMFTYGFANQTIQNYYQYYAADMLTLPERITSFYTVADVEAASSLFNLANLLGSVLASFPVGHVADRIGRSWILAAAVLCQMVVPLVMMFTRSLLADVLCNVLYGAGFTSTNLLCFAILTELLPTLNPDREADAESAKLLKPRRKSRSTNVGLGTSLYIILSNSVPILFMPMLSGYILDHFYAINQRVDAYYTIYGVSVFCLFLALIVLPFLRTKYDDCGARQSNSTVQS